MLKEWILTTDWSADDYMNAIQNLWDTERVLQEVVNYGEFEGLTSIEVIECKLVVSKVKKALIKQLREINKSNG